MNEINLVVSEEHFVKKKEQQNFAYEEVPQQVEPKVIWVEA